MNKKWVPDPREIAIADELRARIAGSPWKNVAAFSRALDESGTPTDYTTLYKRVNGQAQLPTNVLLPALDLLGVNYIEFVTDAMKHVKLD